MPKSITFFSSVSSYFFWFQNSLWTFTCGCLGLLGPLVGTQERKNADSCMRKPLFRNRLFGLSELHLALLGSSIPLPGQSWGADGSQKTLKSGPKLGQKWVQKGIQFWVALGPILGPVLGPKKRRSAGPFFGVSRDGQRHHLHQHLDSI